MPITHSADLAISGSALAPTRGGTPFRSPIFAAIAFLASLFVSPIAAQESDSQILDEWVIAGFPSTHAVKDGVLYIAGHIYGFGSPTGSGVPVSASTGVPLGSFAKVEGSVSEVAPDGAGGWYIGGEFSTIEGVQRKHLARIRSDGSLDQKWNPNADGDIRTIAVSDSAVYVGGSFSQIGGVPRHFVAALDRETGRPTPWNPGSNAPVISLVVSEGTVFASGTFSHIGGQDRNFLAALEARSGRATPWNPNANGLVHCLSVRGPTVYAGGEFTVIGGQKRLRLAALDANSGTATGWNVPADGTVLAIATHGSRVFVGGEFNELNGETRRAFAALDAATGRLISSAPSPARRDIFGERDTHVNNIAVSGDDIYVGGSFFYLDGFERDRVAAFNSRTNEVLPFRSELIGHVVALAANGDNVYIGGDLQSVGMTSRSGAAAIDMNTVQLTGWNPASGAMPELPSAMDISPSRLYYGGETRIGSVDLMTGQPTDWKPTIGRDGMVFFDVFCLYSYGDVVYCGGSFNSVGGTKQLLNSIGGERRENIVAINAITGHPLPWAPDADGNVSTIVRNGSIVYVGGEFQRIGGQARRYIAAVSAETGRATTWSPNASDPIRLIRISGSTLYAIGDFSSIGGQIRNKVAALDMVTGLLPSGTREFKAILVV